VVTITADVAVLRLAFQRPSASPREFANVPAIATVSNASLGMFNSSNMSTKVGTSAQSRHHWMMVEIIESSVFTDWFDDPPDAEAKARILVRIRRLTLGNPGDVKPVGGGVSEMRINYGSGSRLCYRKRGNHLVILPCGGDNSTPAKDIARSQFISDQWKD
jgi:putative addiction module killer protein